MPIFSELYINITLCFCMLFKAAFPSEFISRYVQESCLYNLFLQVMQKSFLQYSFDIIVSVRFYANVNKLLTGLWRKLSICLYTCCCLIWLLELLGLSPFLSNWRQTPPPMVRTVWSGGGGIVWLPAAA